VLADVDAGDGRHRRERERSQDEQRDLVGAAYGLEIVGEIRKADAAVLNRLVLLLRGVDESYNRGRFGRHLYLPRAARVPANVNRRVESDQPVLSRTSRFRDVVVSRRSGRSHPDRAPYPASITARGRPGAT
jgi:hypothetical protein